MFCLAGLVTRPELTFYNDRKPLKLLACSFSPSISLALHFHFLSFLFWPWICNTRKKGRPSCLDTSGSVFEPWNSLKRSHTCARSETEYYRFISWIEPICACMKVGSAKRPRKERNCWHFCQCMNSKKLLSNKKHIAHVHSIIQFSAI